MNQTIDNEIRSYIEAVEQHLDDLPEGERRELLEDLSDHLREVAAEGEGTLEDRIGPPEKYAAELRVSAGLSDRDASRWSSVRGLVGRVSAVREIGVVKGIADFLPQLRPAWWVLRGYLAILAIDAFLFVPNGTSALIVPIPYFNGSQGLGLIAIGLAIWASVALGRRSQGDRRAGYMNSAATVAVLLLVMTTSPFEPDYNYVGVEYAETTYMEWLHHKDGAAISNICAYDSKLRPLDRVLLYDQDGRPIDNHAPPEWADETIPGAELERGLGNAYPRPQPLVNPKTGGPKAFECPTLETKKAEPPAKKK